MRRLTRHLFTLCSAASLLLCVAACVVWVRSFSVRDDVSLTIADTLIVFTSGRGNCAAYVVGHWPHDESLAWWKGGPEGGDGFVYTDSTRPGALWGPGPDDPEIHCGWIRVQMVGGNVLWPDRRGVPASSVPPAASAALPMWRFSSYHAVLCSVLVAPAALLKLRRLLATYCRRRRMAAMRCLSCGYDLRASPERCPECGTPANPVSA